MATVDLNAVSNLLNRVLDKIDLESRSLAAAKLAVIISVVFALLTTLAIAASIRADLRSEMLTQQNEKLYNAFSVIRIRTAKMDAWLKAHGVPVEDVYGPELEREYNEALKEIFE